MDKVDDSEFTIERCPHDRENPYAQISRALIRDNSISPNCRMILIFLLSNDEKWTIRPRQIWQHFKQYIGRNVVYKLIDEAMQAGYLSREESLKKNMKQYKYYLSEQPRFKKIHRCPGFGDTGRRDTENGDTLEESSQERTSKETTTKKKKEQATPVVAVSFDKDGEKKKEPAKPKTYECLEVYPDVGGANTELPRKEKNWITKHHDEETVKNAILWAQNETEPFSKGLAAAIKWACKERPQIAKNAMRQKEENRIYAMNYDGMESGGVKIDCCNSYVSFEWIIPCPTACFCLEYDEKGFMDKFEQKLIQRKFPILR